MKFAIALLIVLGTASIIAVVLGEIYPAGVPGGESFYAARINPAKFRILRTLGVFNPYFSFWYIGLLVLLTLSMLVCMVRRGRALFDLAFRARTRNSLDEVKQIKGSREIRVSASLREAVTAASAYLKKKRYSTECRRETKTAFLYGHKGGLTHIGILLLHFGLVLIFLSGLITTLLGYSVYQYGSPGDILTVPGRNFKIRVDDFTILTTPRGAVKDYLCDLTVLEEDSEIVTKQIEVNRPLRYKGINMYQSSFQPDPRAVKSVILQVRKNGADSPEYRVTIPMNRRIPIPGTDFSLSIVDFAGNFRLEQGRVISAPGIKGFRNPAVKLDLSDKAGRVIKSGWVFTPRMSGFYNYFKEYTMQLVDFDSQYETGLNITYNPGAPGIWAGIIMMTMGIFLIFSLIHKQMWLAFSEITDTKTAIILAGRANKYPESLSEELNTLINHYKQR